MLKNKRHADVDISCPICKDALVEPKLLPCNESICNYCVILNENQYEFKCDLCKNVHQIPTNGFPTDYLLAQKITKRQKNESNTPEAKEFKLIVEEIESNLHQTEFDLLNGDYVISEHCRELKRRVQLAKELKIEELENLSKEMMNKIDCYEQETISIYQKTNKESNAQQFLEIKEVFDKCQINLIQNQEEMKSIKSKLTFEQENIKSLIFNDNVLTFKENNQLLIGNLMPHSLKTIDYNHLQEINFGNLVRDHFYKKYMIDIDSDVIYESRVSFQVAGFFSNGYFFFFVGYTHDETSDLNMFLFDENFKLNRVETINEIYFYDLVICTLSNKICLAYTNVLDDKEYLCVLNDKLVETSKILSGKGGLIGADEDEIYLQCLGDEYPLSIYDWSLNFIRKIGQKTNSNERFYFNKIEDIEIFTLNNKKYFLIFSVDDGLSIMEESTGIVLNHLNIKVHKIYFDLNNNLIIYDQSNVYYYDINGCLLKTIKLLNFPIDAAESWYFYKDNFYFFNQYKFSLLN